MSRAGIDPAERARILLLRGDELLESGTPESLDEALLAYEGGLEVAREPGVDDAELPGMFEKRIATVRRRLEPGGEEDEPAGEGAGADAGGDASWDANGDGDPDGHNGGAGERDGDPGGRDGDGDQDDSEPV